MILCPSFHDGRLDGIGRVSGAFYQALEQLGPPPMVFSANEPDAHCRMFGHRGFGRDYAKMMLTAAFSPIPRPWIIACMHLGLSPAARILSARSKAPYVVFLHGVEAWRPLKLRSRLGLAKASLLLANSQFTLSRFLAVNPFAAHLPSLVTPLGIGELPQPVEDTAKPPGSAILTVSRMDKADSYKGHRILIDSLGTLVDKYPDLTLTVAGDGDDRADIEAHAAATPYAARIRFLGKVDDAGLRRLYPASDIFALPSGGEGFGLVFLEAMSHALPCVCGDTDASREVVTDGVTGFCVPPGDHLALAGRLDRLLDDPDLRRSLGRAGRERYLAGFTSEHFQERIRAALAPLMGGN